MWHAITRTIRFSHLPLYFALPGQNLLNLLVQLGVESVRYFDLHFFAQALPKHFREHFGLVGSLVRLNQLVLIHVTEIFWQADPSRLSVI